MIIFTIVTFDLKNLKLYIYTIFVIFIILYNISTIYLQNFIRTFILTS